MLPVRLSSLSSGGGLRGTDFAGPALITHNFFVVPATYRHEALYGTSQKANLLSRLAVEYVTDMLSDKHRHVGFIF
jgi:hypothetical protein